MKTFLGILAFIAVAIIALLIADHFYYKSFEDQAEIAKQDAAMFDDMPITELELKKVPPPVAKYLRYCGFVGKPRISFMYLTHGGEFKQGADKKFIPIEGEYYLTTKKPSFNWFGRLKMFPGITTSAFDSYQNGKGKMIVKFMSVVKIVEAAGEKTNISALGRCFAEMTMVPSFFLDEERIEWLSFDSTSASCIFSDKDISTKAAMFFNKDGSLNRIEVNRFYDHSGGQPALEKFTGKCSEYKNFNGIKLATVYDGIWNLKSGDFHYVHFVVDKVNYE